MRTARKTFTIIGLSLLIVSLGIILVSSLISIKDIHSVTSGGTGSSYAFRGIYIALIVIMSSDSALGILLAGLGIGRCVKKDKQTKLIPWAYIMYPLILTVLALVGVVAIAIAGSNVPPSTLLIVSYVLLGAMIIDMIVTLCLSRRKVGFAVALMLEISILMAFIICDWHFAKEQGSAMDALGWAYSIIMFASAAFIFIECIFSFGERPSSRGYRPKPVYDEYGYIVKQPRETAPRPAPIAQPQPASQMAQGEVDAVKELKRLKLLLDEGMITKEEYEEKRKKYLDLL